ncbi:multidrug-resistance type transporter aminotriazole resistance [Recurvomyces mirabilis]|uniref:Multidrug-resistance type transporter aminotriazole resistance n=1 Tax=Recurvomyces mirabilis TaxID=574656 RepID=A0AAE1BZ54_9PEZI|nr:multidrug-resistance type transporter aminotriazole resistance [Recurvomyces mirabilis]KAK5153297.1 multidrug-resistance type transporter aminotriazole resistance [Recurvomyces mirabilis]
MEGGVPRDHRPLEPEEKLPPPRLNNDDDDNEGYKAQRTQTQESGLRHTMSLEKQVPLAREVLVIAIVCLSQFCTQVGLGQTLSILRIIADSFGIDDPGLQSWLIAGYSLSVGTFILLFGRMGDVFGYKHMLVIGYSWFALWSMVAGLAIYSNYVLFVFARVLQGIGPSICLPNGLALLGALYEPGPRKNMAFAMFGACAPAGSIVGAVFGGLFALVWWPWTFWSFAITLAVIALAAAWLVPDPQVYGERPRTVKGWIDELDLAAGTVGVVGLILINFAWNQAPIVGWQSPYVCVCLVLGILLVPLFFWLELKVSPNPLIPFSAFTSTNAFVLSCMACGWGSFGIWVYELWTILFVLRGSSPLLASAYLSPLVLSGAIAAVATGFLLSHLRPAYLMVIAMSAFLTGNLLIATVPPHQIYWAQFFVTSIIACWGMDMSFPAATIYLSNTIEKSKQGVAASLVNTIVNYSISIALGFAGTVEAHVNHGGQTDRDKLDGYRGALYMGTGLSGMGLAISIVFLAKTYWEDRKQRPIDPEAKSSPSEETT